jgi:predicted O-methyltransferase YrrM
MTEPTTEDAIQAWIDEHEHTVDPFASVYDRTESHREEHGCDAYASSAGALTAMVRLARPARSLEIGTALGYGALTIAHAGGGRVDTVELDPAHAVLAREAIDEHGFADRVTVIEGRDLDVLAAMTEPYDLIFYDAFVPTVAHLDEFERLLDPGGVLLTSNLFLGRYVPDLPELVDGAAYRERLFEPGWSTTFASSKAVSFRT